MMIIALLVLSPFAVWDHRLKSPSGIALNKSTCKPAWLVLEDGSTFFGQSLGVTGVRTGEVVFNTAMTGYQEILTDPSYAEQLVTLTCPHVGNVGTNPEDVEADEVFCAGLLIRNIPTTTGNWRTRQSLAEFLTAHTMVAIGGIDTRQLTRRLRSGGAQRGCLVADESLTVEEAIVRAQTTPPLLGRDLVKRVTTRQVYPWRAGEWQRDGYRTPPPPRFNVVVSDYGCKHNILRQLAAHGCNLTVVPATATATEIMAYQPHGVFLSNGPGDPAACDYAIATIRALLDVRVPLFGICLGHQLLALAGGAATEKMKFGHHGANHPVQELATQRVFISSQNHGFTVADRALPTTLEVTHRSLFDRSIQGLRHRDCPAFSFQGHPEASPGPHDLQRLFAQFITLMETASR